MFTTKQSKLQELIEEMNDIINEMEMIKKEMINAIKNNESIKLTELAKKFEWKNYMRIVTQNSIDEVYYS